MTGWARPTFWPTRCLLRADLSTLWQLQRVTKRND